MGSTRALLLAGAMALGVANTARAADLPPPPPPAYLPPPPAEIIPYGGWYLRGDVGAGLSFSSDIRSSFVDGTGASVSDSVIKQDIQNFHRDSQKIDDTGFVDVGVGYEFNDWFRMDVTGQVRSSQHFSTVESYGLDYVPGAVPGQIGHDNYHGSVQSSVFLVNGYADLGTWYGATPYIGAGVGAAYIRMGALTDLNPGTTVNLTDGTTTLVGLGGGGFADGKSKFNLAYAGMLGFSYNLTSNLKLDVGYTYLNMGSVTSNKITCLSSGCSGTPPIYERQRLSLASNDIHIGLRWLINDYVPAPPPPPPMMPIIRKD